MVAVGEIVFVVVCLGLGVWWFTHTSIFRAIRRSGFADPGQHGHGTEPGMSVRVEPPNRRSHRQ
jgi:hypothetical protein